MRTTRAAFWLGGPLSDPPFRLVWWLALAAWIGLIIRLGLIPSVNTPPLFTMTGIPHFDKVVHVGLYAMGSLLVAGLFGGRVFSLWLLCGMALFGVIDEGIQTLSRPPELEDILDWVMDIIGSGLGIYGWLLIRKRLSLDIASFRHFAMLTVIVIAFGVGLVYGQSKNWEGLKEAAKTLHQAEQPELTE